MDSSKACAICKKELNGYFSEEDIASLLDVANHMEIPWQSNWTALIVAPILSSVMDINAGNKGFSVNPAESDWLLQGDCQMAAMGKYWFLLEDTL